MSLSPRFARTMIVVVPIAVAVLLSFLVFEALPAMGAAGLMRLWGEHGASAQQTRDVPGDPTRFDPIAALDAVLAWAGPNAKLERIYVSGVRRDGTLDLTADFSPAPSATYELHREVEAPDHAPPVGAGGSTDGRWFQPLRIEALKPGKRRQTTRIGDGSAERFWYVSRGLDLHEGDVTGAPSQAAIPLPTCNVASLWARAIAQGAPPEAVARIRYDARGYALAIPGIFNGRYGMDCADAR